MPPTTVATLTACGARPLRGMCDLGSKEERRTRQDRDLDQPTALNRFNATDFQIAHFVPRRSPACLVELRGTYTAVCRAKSTNG